MEASLIDGWLMEACSCNCANGQVPECIVIVSHADFLALLLAALNKMDAQGASENPDYDVSR